MITEKKEKKKTEKKKKGYWGKSNIRGGLGVIIYQTVMILILYKGYRKHLY